MKNTVILNAIERVKSWIAPEPSGQLPFGDMPGDKIQIEQDHINKASLIFPELLKEMKLVAEKSNQKIVISVCGGSGVGKSETATLLSYYLGEIGLKSYTLSGDNYPKRIPQYNDAERLKIFRESGILGMIADGVYKREYYDIIQKLQRDGIDASEEYCKEYKWYESYINGGRKALQAYLGTKNEIQFDILNGIISDFKLGKEHIMLKRMGRTDSELWYDDIEFSDIQVLVIEWTHGNNDNLEGVDIPVLLNSTPEETLAHRRSRNRDGGVDSPFIMTVLGIEQGLLMDQSKKAKIIVSKAGNLLSYDEYLNL